MYFIILKNINKTSKTRDINKNDIEKMGTNILSKKKRRWEQTHVHPLFQVFRLSAERFHSCK